MAAFRLESIGSLTATDNLHVSVILFMEEKKGKYRKELYFWLRCFMYFFVNLILIIIFSLAKICVLNSQVAKICVLNTIIYQNRAYPEAEALDSNQFDVLSSSPYINQSQQA